MTKAELEERVEELEGLLEESQDECSRLEDAEEQAAQKADVLEDQAIARDEMLCEAMEFIRPMADTYPGLDCTPNEHARYSDARTLVSDMGALEL